MKIWKKVLAIALAGALAFAMAACGGGSSSSETTAAASDETTAAEAAETTAAQAEESAEADAEGKSFDKIVFGTNAEFPPFEFVASNGVLGEFDGIDMAIAKQIGEELGAEVEINNMEFDSLIIALGNGQIDACIAGMTVTDERKESVDFTTPYYEATQVMIVKEDSDIAKASDMEGKTIAVIQGYTGEISVQGLGYEYESFKKGTDAIMELINGKADVVVIDSATAQKYVADNEGLKIVEDPEVFEGEEYAIAIAKGNTELLDAINGVIEKMLADGTIAELGAQYAVAE